MKNTVKKGIAQLLKSRIALFCAQHYESLYYQYVSYFQYPTKLEIHFSSNSQLCLKINQIL